MNWVVVATAPDQITAEVWVGLLKDAGLPAMVDPSDAPSFLGVSGTSCRVLVPAERLEEARDLLVAAVPIPRITENGGAPDDDEPPAA